MNDTIVITEDGAEYEFLTYRKKLKQPDKTRSEWLRTLECGMK